MNLRSQELFLINYITFTLVSATCLAPNRASAGFIKEDHSIHEKITHAQKKVENYQGIATLLEEMGPDRLYIDDIQLAKARSLVDKWTFVLERLQIAVSPEGAHDPHPLDPENLLEPILSLDLRIEHHDLPTDVSPSTVTQYDRIFFGLFVHDSHAVGNDGPRGFLEQWFARTTLRELTYRIRGDNPARVSDVAEAWIHELRQNKALLTLGVAWFRLKTVLEKMDDGERSVEYMARQNLVQSMIEAWIRAALALPSPAAAVVFVPAWPDEVRPFLPIVQTWSDPVTELRSTDREIISIASPAWALHDHEASAGSWNAGHPNPADQIR